MHPIYSSVFATLLVAGFAWTETMPSGVPSPAGTLTCTTRPEASLVFGLTPVADCTYVSDDGATREGYAAMLGRVPGQREVASETVRWRVETADEASRAGMLAGPFAPAPTGDAAPVLRNRGVDLHVLTSSRRSAAIFALQQPRVDLVAMKVASVR